MALNVFNSIYLKPSNFNDSIQNNEESWSRLLDQKGNAYIHCTEDMFHKLTSSYWKSILPNLTPDDAYKLHCMNILDNHLKTKYPNSNMYDQEKLKLKQLSKNEFSTIFNEAPIIISLKKIDEDSYPFEYQFATYAATCKQKYKAATLKKVKKITYDNWIFELDILRINLINAIFDLNNLLPEKHKLDYTSPETLELQMKSNFYLSWCFDETLNTTRGSLISSDNFTYLKENYPVEIFTVLYTGFYKLWGTSEDMTELTQLIYNENFEYLLDRDIARNFGCVYSNNKFYSKMDQAFVSYLYANARSNQTKALKPFSIVKID
ncbi:MAG: hypothetical protein ACK41T_00250 [Pseudobdellovibrio sp.]